MRSIFISENHCRFRYLGTQTDQDAATQTEFPYIKPPRRRARSDNDVSDVSDEELSPPYTKTRTRKGHQVRKQGVSIRRKIKTPIQEESESNMEAAEYQLAPSTSAIGRIRTSIIKELFMEKPRFSSHTLRPTRSAIKREVLRELVETRPTRSAIRKDVLREIADSLVHSEDSGSEDNIYVYKQLSGSSFTSSVTSSDQKRKCHSENDIRQKSSEEHVKVRLGTY